MAISNIGSNALSSCSKLSASQTINKVCSKRLECILWTFTPWSQGFPVSLWMWSFYWIMRLASWIVMTWSDHKKHLLTPCFADLILTHKMTRGEKSSPSLRRIVKSQKAHMSVVRPSANPMIALPQVFALWYPMIWIRITRFGCMWSLEKCTHSVPDHIRNKKTPRVIRYSVDFYGTVCPNGRSLWSDGWGGLCGILPCERDRIAQIIYGARRLSRSEELSGSAVLMIEGCFQWEHPFKQLQPQLLFVLRILLWFQPEFALIYRIVSCSSPIFIAHKLHTSLLK